MRKNVGNSWENHHSEIVESKMIIFNQISTLSCEKTFMWNECFELVSKITFKLQKRQKIFEKPFRSNSRSDEARNDPELCGVILSSTLQVAKMARERESERATKIPECKGLSSSISMRKMNSVFCVPESKLSDVPHSRIVFSKHWRHLRTNERDRDRV